MKKLLVALLVLVVLLLGADRLAERLAEGRIAQQLSADLSADPAVEIGGFPFLTQALRGRYDSIRVSGDAATREGVRVTDFSADLEGVRVPLGDALGGRIADVPVDRLQGRALVTYADFAAAAKLPGLQLAPAGSEVRVTGPLQVLGQDLTVSALSTAALEGSEIVLRGRSFEVDGRKLPDAISTAISGQLDLRVAATDLPYGLKLTEVRTDERGIVLGGTASDVVLRR